MTGPLSGVVVLDLTQQLVGPGATMLLGDMGAEIIHVEPPPERLPVSSASALDPTGRQRAALVFNRNKRSISVDLSRPDGLEVVKRLAKRADVCIQNYRPGVAEKLGLTYEEIRGVRSDIVYCEISSFGFEGTEHHRVGFDIVAQAGGGAMVPAWSNPSLPAPASVPIGDVTGMCLAALGVVAALHHRERTGEGQRVQTSMLDGVMLQSILRLISVESEDREWRSATLTGISEIARTGGDFSSIFTAGATGIGGLPAADQVGIIQNVYYRAYQTADGFLAVGCLNLNQQRRMNAALSLGDPRFVEGADLASPQVLEAAASMEAKAEALFQSKTTSEWVAELDDKSIACSPVLSLLEVFDHPHHQANKMIVSHEDPWVGGTKMLGHPIRLEKTPMSIRSSMSPVGYDSEEVLASYGFAPPEIDQLISTGIVHRSSVQRPGGAVTPVS